jgi:CheY-like chemotaxis protein
LSTKRVLVVDDHPDSARSLAKVLEILGHAARAITDSRDAVEEAKRFKPNLAIIDLAMPHVDGWELAKLLRADAELKHVCLIALTGFGDEKSRQKTRAAGFDAHLLKPADAEMLRSIIAQFDA